MIKRIIFTLIFALTFSISSSYATESLGEFKCKLYGGKVTNQENYLGNKYKSCEFKDSSKCDLWAFYWGNCHLSETLLSSSQKSTIDNLMKKVDKAISGKSKSSQGTLLLRAIKNVQSAIEKNASKSNEKILNYLLSSLNVRYEAATDSLVKRYKDKYLVTGNITTNNNSTNNSTNGSTNTGSNISTGNNNYVTYTGFEFMSIDIIVKELNTELTKMRASGLDPNLASNIGMSTLLRMIPDSTIGDYKVSDLIIVLYFQQDLNYFRNILNLRQFVANDVFEFPVSVDYNIIGSTRLDDYKRMSIVQLQSELTYLENEIYREKLSGINVALAKIMGYNNLMKLPLDYKLGNTAVKDLERVLLLQTRIDYIKSLNIINN